MAKADDAGEGPPSEEDEDEEPGRMHEVDEWCWACWAIFRAVITSVEVRLEPGADLDNNGGQLEPQPSRPMTPKWPLEGSEVGWESSEKEEILRVFHAMCSDEEGSNRLVLLVLFE